MIFYKTHPLSILMILMLIFSKPAYISAQKSTDFCLNWQIVDSLPTPHIGVAGAFAGVYQEIMLIAGGANFPNGMPWEGAKRNTATRFLYLLKIRKESYIGLIKHSTCQILSHTARLFQHRKALFA